MGILPENFKREIIKEIMKDQIPTNCRQCNATLWYNPVKRREENKWLITCPYCGSDVYCPENMEDNMDYLMYASDRDETLYYRYRNNERAIEEYKKSFARLLIEQEIVKSHIILRNHGRMPYIPKLDDIKL